MPVYEEFILYFRVDFIPNWRQIQTIRHFEKNRTRDNEMNSDQYAQMP